MNVLTLYLLSSSTANLLETKVQLILVRYLRLPWWKAGNFQTKSR